MKPHWRYLKYVIRHKWFVLVAGHKTGAPLWRLVIHDWSKFTPAEWMPYVSKFYGNWGHADSLEHADAIKKAVDAAFNRAWLHHQHRNPHHWQHWVLREDEGGVKVIEMPDDFIREMVADWMGAGRAITGKWEVVKWYRENEAKIWPMGERTKARVEQLLRKVG